MPDAAAWLARIHALKLRQPVRVLNVCGGHERSISMAALRGILPDAIELIPGPGCPVCVCPEEDIVTAIQFTARAGVILVAFGDMLRVPANVARGELRSLAEARTAGAPRGLPRRHPDGPRLADGGMTDFSFLADDVLVDALIMEVSGLLGRLIEDDESACIDLLGLPLSPACIAALEQRLGQGEVTVKLDAAGHSEIRKTAFPGVWWIRHHDEAGRMVAMQIEVTVVPQIVCADVEDMRLAYRRLPGCTSVAQRSA